MGTLWLYPDPVSVLFYFILVKFSLVLVFFAVLGLGPGSECILGSSSTIEIYPQALFT